MSKLPNPPNNLPTIPAGFIRAWNDPENIPKGWALCDGKHNEHLPENWVLHSGSNNTPDMRDRFLATKDSQGNLTLASVFIIKLQEQTV